jgi:hypothetical protein
LDVGGLRPKHGMGRGSSIRHGGEEARRRRGITLTWRRW